LGAGLLHEIISNKGDGMEKFLLEICASVLKKLIFHPFVNYLDIEGLLKNLEREDSHYEVMPY
jgi:hypothetical protein